MNELGLGGLPVDLLDNFAKPRQEGERLGVESNRQYARFYKQRIREPRATKFTVDPKSGTAVGTDFEVFEREVEMVEVVTPGDKNDVHTVAELYHKREFSRQYMAFREGRLTPLGKPIEECTYIPASIAFELQINKVMTEEMLAEASDHLCELVPGLAQYRAIAQSIRSDVKKADPNVSILISENRELKDQMAALQRQVQAVMANQPNPNIQAKLDAAAKAAERASKSALKAAKPRKTRTRVPQPVE